MELIVESYCDLFRNDTSLQILPLLTTCHLLKSLTIPYLYSSITLTKNSQWPRLVSKACPSSFRFIKSFVVGKIRVNQKSNQKSNEDDDKTSTSGDTAENLPGDKNKEVDEDVDLQDIKNGPLITELRNVRGKKEHQKRVSEAKKVGNGGGQELGVYKGLVVDVDYFSCHREIWTISRAVSFFNPRHIVCEGILGFQDLKPHYNAKPNLEILEVYGPSKRFTKHLKDMDWLLQSRDYKIKEFHFHYTVKEGNDGYTLDGARSLSEGIKSIAKLRTTTKVSVFYDLVPHAFCYSATIPAEGTEDWQRKVDLKGCGGREDCPLAGSNLELEHATLSQRVSELFQPLRHVTSSSTAARSSDSVMAV